MTAYNECLAKVAREENVLYVGEVLEPDYGDADFIDNGHFSPSGHAKFAKTLAPKLAALKLSAPPKNSGPTP
jgi:lysophospholipase L1-like esterase